MIPDCLIINWDILALSIVGNFQMFVDNCPILINNQITYIICILVPFIIIALLVLAELTTLAIAIVVIAGVVIVLIHFWHKN